MCRTFLEEREPENKFFADTRLHLHVPEGATPKVKILYSWPVEGSDQIDFFRMVQVLVSQLLLHSSPSLQTPQFYQVTIHPIYPFTKNQFQIWPWRGSSVLGAEFYLLVASKKRFPTAITFNSGSFCVPSKFLSSFSGDCCQESWCKDSCSSQWQQERLWRPSWPDQGWCRRSLCRKLWSSLQDCFFGSSEVAQPMWGWATLCFKAITGFRTRHDSLTLTPPNVPQVFCLECGIFELWCERPCQCNGSACLCGEKPQNVGCGDATWNWNISEYFEKSEMLPNKWKFNQIYETQQNEVSFWWFIVQCINVRFLLMRNALLRFQSIGMRCTSYIWTAESFSQNTTPRTKTYYELCSVIEDGKPSLTGFSSILSLPVHPSSRMFPVNLYHEVMPFLIKLGHW